jgi:CheY-like chemotaxis protein
MHERPRCVLVDDDRDFLLLGQRLLSTLAPELEVIAFSSGTEALDYLKHNQASLVITDFRMPDVDGLQLTSTVRLADKEIPIVMISGDEIEDEALIRGASAFIPKRTLARQLASVIRALGIPVRV